MPVRPDTGTMSAVGYAIELWRRGDSHDGAAIQELYDACLSVRD